MVDDDPAVRRALLRLLRSADLRARAFDTATALLDATGGSAPACVLLDLHMANMSGVALQARLALCLPELPVIIMTGQDSPEMRKRVMLHGPVAYLLKPMHDQELLDAIALAMARR